MAGFFERVLPTGGGYTLFSGETGPNGKLISVRHWNGLKTIAEVEREVTRLSLTPVNVFYAAGSFAGHNREDPIAKKCFWLDLDSKEFQSKENALREFTVFVKATGLPKPSIIVDSGNGLHTYWCLDRDLPVALWQPIAQALKDKCDELDFPADPSSTADPARVLRAPGSLNRKGSTPLPCHIMLDNGSVYSPEDISKQLQVVYTLSPTITLLGSLVNNQDLISRQDYQNRSDAEVRDMLAAIQLPPAGGGACRTMWVEVLLAVQDWSQKSDHGFKLFAEWSAGQPGFVSEQDCRKTWDSFEPGGGITIATLIKLAREAGWNDTPAVPLAIDPNASFAEQVAATPSPAAQPPPPHVQAIQGVSRLGLACSHAVEALGRRRFDYKTAMQWLSTEFVMIIQQEGIYYSKTERMCLSKTMINDLLGRFMPRNSQNQVILPGKILQTEGTVYTAHLPGFHPGEGTLYKEGEHTYVNLYTEPAPFIEPTDHEIDMVNALWNYCFPTEQDQDFSQYLMGFYGHIVQRPSMKISSAPVLVSEKTGTGRTTLTWDIPHALVGGANARMVSNKVLRSQFSDFISGTHFVHFDEIHINGRWDSDDTANALKNLITGKTVEVHPKGLAPFNIPNRIFATATSNYSDAITLPRDDERRWGIYCLNPLQPLGATFFKIFHAWLVSARGPGVLRSIFNSFDISHFNPHAAPPVTDAKHLMVRKSQANEVQIVLDAVEQQMGPLGQAVYTPQQVAGWLQSQTGKNYPVMQVRGYLEKIPNARKVRDLRYGDGLKETIWCHTNFEYWAAATPGEIRKELQGY